MKYPEIFSADTIWKYMDDICQLLQTISHSSIIDFMQWSELNPYVLRPSEFKSNKKYNVVVFFNLQSLKLKWYAVV